MVRSATVVAAAMAGLVLARAAPARELTFPVGEGDFTWESYEAFAAEHDFTGQTIQITATWTGQEKAYFESVLDYFRAATGAEVLYAGSDANAQNIIVSTRAGSPPDVAVVPQPGVVADLAAGGYLTPLGEEAREWVRENYAAGESWVDLGTYEGPDDEPAFYGIFYRVDLKSLVWYEPGSFAEAGYEVPETLEELRALTERIAAEGATPWCLGLGSGAASGWPGTDWVEDLLLRRESLEVYDGWIAGEVEFTDPRIVAAVEDYGWFARNDDFVDGGSSAAATTDFRDSAAGLFTFPPDCYMIKQATFLQSFFPEGTRVGTDVDFFYFPVNPGAEFGRPVMGSGTQFVITRDRPISHAFMAFLRTPIAHEIWMAQSSFQTPYLEAETAVFPTDAQRALNAILTEASSFRFDASDQMPAEVGTAAFWSEIINYTAGTADAESAMRRVQNVWDAVE